MGLLARLGMSGSWPLWVWVKIGIWLVLGAATALIRRLPAHFAWLIFLLPLIGTIAAYMAFYKPGAG